MEPCEKKKKKREKLNGETGRKQQSRRVMGAIRGESEEKRHAALLRGPEDSTSKNTKGTPYN
jgi:hypothetical protein